MRGAIKILMIILITLIVILGLLLLYINKPFDLSNDLNFTTSQGMSPDTKVLKLDNSSFDNIMAKLALSKGVYGITPSNDKEYIAFVDGNPNELTGQLFIWKVRENQPVAIPISEQRISEIKWSPKDDYIFVNTGTSSVRNGKIITAKDYSIIDEIEFVGKTYWADSNTLILATFGEAIPSISVEWDHSTDLIFYNLETKEKKIIAEGSSDFYFLTFGLQGDNTLIYEKRYFDGSESEKLRIAWGSK